MGRGDKVISRSHQDSGQKFQQWMEGPDVEGQEPCEVKASEVQIEHLPVMNHTTDNSDCRFEIAVLREGSRVGVLHSGPRVRIEIRDGPSVAESPNAWNGIVTNGALFLLELHRQYGPHAPEISQAAYEACYPITTLRHIIIPEAINDDTKLVVLNLIGGRPLRTEVRNEWDYGTPEYQAILGTELGKVVASLVLSAFGRGTCHVARIFTWINRNHTMGMRFDLSFDKPSVLRKGKMPASEVEKHAGGRGSDGFTPQASNAVRA